MEGLTLLIQSLDLIVAIAGLLYQWYKAKQWKMTAPATQT